MGRFFPSSQKCSNCGYQYHDLELGEEDWICPVCGKHHDRDLNASINIKNEGLRLIREKIIKTISYWDCHGLRCAGIGSKVLTFHSTRGHVKKSRIPNFLKVGGSSSFGTVKEYYEKSFRKTLSSTNAHKTLIKYLSLKFENTSTSASRG